MSVSFILEKDLTALKDMRKYCFSIDDDSAARSLENRYTPENYLGYFEEEHLVASAEICPFNIYFHRSLVGMGGIAWVASFPEYRNKGYVRDMLQHSLLLMKERKQYFSFLGPFSYEFYRRMGWGLSFVFYEFMVDMKHIQQTKSKDYVPVPYQGNRLEDIIRLYQQTQINCNGPVVRNSRMLEKILHNRYCYLFYASTGELKGYMIFNIQGDTFKIHEMITADSKVKREMFSFAGKHSAQVKQIQFNTYDKQDLFLFGEHYSNRYSLKTFMQARVVDVENILKLIKPATNENHMVAVKINDNLAPWNHHTFLVTVDNQLVSVAIDDTLEPDITCDIDRFSQLAIGAMSAKNAVESGFVEIKPGTDINALNNLFYEKPIALYDYF